ncbi:hypothetical protein CMUS01_07831 [Colletotrichum musicola]|uniref:Uncharacterized protein n=1 Tax=Colletotrichum musicola TaxID=2175873 RepID=A0A8H6KFS2_9PEZI|nr:hypothetical protein CMUS01_07831 [Colletotrichum musicola]
MFGRMGLAVKRLSKDVFSAKSATPELAHVLYQAANLEEESIVNSINPSLGEQQDFRLGRACQGWFWLERWPRVSALASALSNWTTTRERVNLWMLEVLHKSDHLLAMLRCSAFLGPGEGQCQEPSGSEGAPADDQARGESQFWGRQWTADLLGVFERDLSHPVDDHRVEQSIGAVDSRDDDGVFEIPMRQARPTTGSTELWAT